MKPILDDHNYVLRAVNGQNDMLYAIRYAGAIACRRDGNMRLWHSEDAALRALAKMQGSDVASRNRAATA